MTTTPADKSKCTSCMACYSACPVSAIEIQCDKDGFYYPVIDKEKCTNCSICKKVCPVLNQKTKKTSFVQEIYACTNKNEEVRMKSSSGGIFSLLAESLAAVGGGNSGVIFDKDRTVKHIVSKDKADIEKMRGSKYVQSYIGDCFKDIKSLLEQNTPVLFSGTPCQVDGLKSFLQKDYENLFTVDVLCNSYIPPYLLNEYLESIAGNDYKDISFNMREKSAGWTKGINLAIEWIDQNGVKKTYVDLQNSSPLIKAFLSHLCIKESCIDCIYKKPQRCSDLTIGDFWRIENIDTSLSTLNDNKGLSMVIINTEKGKKLFESVKENMGLYKRIDFKETLKTQTSLTGTIYNHKNRDKFFEYAQKAHSKMELIKDLLSDNEVKILTFPFPANYGAQMQCWALSEKIKELGFSPKVIKYAPFYKDTLGIEKNLFTEFRDQNTPMTKLCYSSKEFESELLNCNKVIIGGDVTFREWPQDITMPRFRFFGDWVHGKRTLANYGSSFRNEHFQGPESVTVELKKLIKRFDRLSSREQSGVKILKDVFDSEAIEVLDSVFLHDRSKYDELIKKKNIPEIKKDYIGCFILGGVEKINDKEHIQEKTGLEIIDIGLNQKEKPAEVEQWLNNIKNAKFVITDSFHCAAFAMIYKRPFIIINRIIPAGADDYRIKNFLKNFNLTSQFRQSLKDITADDITDNFNWSEIDRIMEERKKISIDYLLDILLLEPKFKEKYINDELNIVRSACELEYEKNKIFRYIEEAQNKNITPIQKISFLEKLFSVKNQYSNNKRYKVVRILGIKIKFSQKNKSHRTE